MANDTCTDRANEQLLNEEEYTSATCVGSNLIPQPSEWRCELFGCGGSLVMRPNHGNVPNRFWRWMQYLAFGNRWIRD